VDDFLIVSTEWQQVQWVKDKLSEEYTVHDLGEVKDFLGCEVVRNRSNRTFRMTCQPNVTVSSYIAVVVYLYRELGYLSTVPVRVRVAPSVSVV
jgi:hypothetical protein